MDITRKGDKLEISISVPLTITGPETYGDGEWSAPGVIVVINDKTEEYALYHTQFLDYKDSLQATSPIVYFESKEAAMEAAETLGLGIEFHDYSIDN